jgi:hypothetical protein
MTRWRFFGAGMLLHRYRNWAQERAFEDLHTRNEDFDGGPWLLWGDLWAVSVLHVRMGFGG